jgi:hypothetical protein
VSSLVRSEYKWTAGLLIAGFVIALAIVKGYRANGHEPRFYQENFGPAVMMACGYGFTAPPFGSTPRSLLAFLRLESNTFSCADFPQPMPTETVTWNGTWYYLYGTTAFIWRVAGISWTVLDYLAAVFGGIMLATLYALFRLVAPRLVAVGLALFVMLSPAHVEQIRMLRDYSKGPLVLLSVLVLAHLVLRAHTLRATLGLAVLFGTVVGLGFGFRSDLIVMVPFGLAVILFCLPGLLRDHWRRNVAAATLALFAFLTAGYPPLNGQRTGGCQFHYALLGMTTPLVTSMNGEPPIYRFGDHFLDTFVDLKVGDFAERVSGLPTPNLCAPEYDAASAALFTELARTFPADLVAHAYGSVLTILRAGFTLPRFEMLARWFPPVAPAAPLLDAAFHYVGLSGPIVTALAVGAAFAASWRLGITLAAFILFLGGYPAIEFEGRHWFHLRFIPLWAACAVAASWLAASPAQRVAGVRRGVVGVVAMIVLLASAITIIRMVQRGSAEALIARYMAAPTEPVGFAADGPSRRRVDWRPVNYAPPPGHRSSDMLVVTVDSTGCGEGSVRLRFSYEFDNVGHDMSTNLLVHRVAGGPPTQVFFPVFSQGHLDLTYLRFAAIETPGRSADCISSVSRFSDRRALPLWLQVQAPPDWRERPLYQGLQ